MKPTFHGEVQFAGYADGSRGGPRITFRLEDRKALDTFAGLEGKRYMLAIVEIGDDEQPAEPAPKREQRTPRARMAPLCEWTVLRCSEEPFQRWIKVVYDKHMGGNGHGWGDVTPDDFGGRMDAYAAHCVKVLCNVDSRKELDTDNAAAAKLHEVIRKPYTAWLKQDWVPA